MFRYRPLCVSVSISLNTKTALLHCFLCCDEISAAREIYFAISYSLQPPGSRRRVAGPWDPTPPTQS